MVVAFDVDGTLFDTKREIISALNTVLKKNGVQEITKEEENTFIGPSFDVTLPIYRYLTYEEVNKVKSEFRLEYQKHVSDSKPYPGLEDVLKSLKNNGIHLCIATNKPVSQVKNLLDHYNLFPYFKIIKAKDDFDKPKAEMLKEIRAEITGEKFYYMVGDTIGDLEAAMKAGYQFIEAAYGYGEFEVKNEYQINIVTDMLRICDIWQKITLYKPIQLKER